MRNWMKRMIPVVGLVLLAGFNQSRSFAADDTPATQPAGSATIVVSVLDKDGKAVSGAQVNLTSPGKKSDSADTTAKKAKSTPVAQGITDDSGKVSFPNLADGKYNISAKMKGEGSGKGKAMIADGANAEVSITLVPRATAAAGADAKPAEPGSGEMK